VAYEDGCVVVEAEDDGEGASGKLAAPARA
jgi:hypothetical protein